jgi:hypothetical protein
MNTTEFDLQFDKIENLTWYPWIGKDYALSNRRILIVGDSHYTVDDDGNFDEECFKNFISDKNTTREYAFDYMKAEKEWNFNRNLRLCLLNVDDKTLLKPLWSKIAFYEFIQEPMKQRDAKPTEEHYKNAWLVFVKIIEIIKPTDCIFIGVRNETCFDYCMRQLGIKYDPVKNMLPIINGTQPREAFIELSNEYNLRLLFIKHTSMGFSYEKWYEFLKKEMPEGMAYLNSF